ncbi:sensor histidine kinase, partial [Streptomonospora algeriensis]
APRAAREIDAAVREALGNVDRHCPPETRVWLLLEDEGETVTVTVRDDGPGIAPDRLDEAAAEGRLGIAQSIRGRIADIGGTTEITTAPGQGTEFEMRVPR